MRSCYRDGNETIGRTNDTLYYFKETKFSYRCGWIRYVNKRFINPLY